MHIIYAMKWSKMCVIGISGDYTENGTEAIYEFKDRECTKNDEHHDQQIQKAWWTSGRINTK